MAAPANALELRVYDLLRPFRNELHQAAASADGDSNFHTAALKLEKKVAVLCQNIAFLAHNHIQNTELEIGAEDVFVVMRGWTGDGVGNSGGAIAVLVRYPAGTMGVVKANLETGANVMDTLCAKVDEMLAEAF
ncbi:hypothetical protein T440DRAFT_517454 [Plenodomus tracheiphilus IPT5]|uniref:Uncharacterized protein n=1 Tax=Plenodomus tracheiphilus IPT5 TaxID=1408161 RepID=A0A6A7B818_9PLEO|nr:hypothetical protein T440DRAFT_517454 [Plenodomus tracheiphilus IPT5]